MISLTYLLFSPKEIKIESMIGKRGYMFLFIWMVIACSSKKGEENKSSERPNIILIMVDDLGYEGVGSYGGTSYKTPNIDDLAASGIRFNQAFAQPLCTPTRVKLMTGKYNFRNWESFGIYCCELSSLGYLF